MLASENKLLLCFAALIALNNVKTCGILLILSVVKLTSTTRVIERCINIGVQLEVTLMLL